MTSLIFSNRLFEVELSFNAYNKTRGHQSFVVVVLCPVRIKIIFFGRYNIIMYWYKESINPNTFAGLVGKVRKKLSPEGGRKGGWRKKARAACPPDPGLEPGTCSVLGEGPPLHARGAV